MVNFDKTLVDSIAAAAGHYRSWCTEDALPLWASRGRNEMGGFYEHLTMDGLADTQADTRIRVNARQVYSFSHVAALGWYPEGKDIALGGDAYMAKYCLLEKGFDGSGEFPGLGFILSPDYAIKDDRIDTYTQAFYFLAMAWLYHATKDDRVLNQANRALEFLNDRLASPTGGWNESIPPSMPRRQNPHMHLFEAFMFLHAATGKPEFLERAGDVYRLFDEHFFDRDHGVLLEFFTEDWKPAPDTGTLIEPGHMMEWVWLLSVYGRLSGADVSTAMRTLYTQALERGMNPVTGLLWDEVDIDGTVTKPTHRSWTLTEFIKASIAMAQLGDEDAAARIPQLVDLLFSTYLATPVRGGWYDQFDRDGNLISDTMPSSTFYHLLCAATELSDLADSLKK